MNVLDVLRGLLRRWYVTIPGVLAAVGIAAVVWSMTPPQYERTASQLLLPGEGVLPEGATNQFLYTGGLSPVADVLTRAVASQAIVRGFVEDGADVTIARDAAASSPVVVITVAAESDAAAASMLDAVLHQTEITLRELQADQGIPLTDRVTISNISVDERSTVRERSRIVVTIVAGLAVLILGLVLASVVDGVAMRRRRRMPGPDEDAAAAEVAPEVEVEVEPAEVEARQAGAGEGYEAVPARAAESADVTAPDVAEVADEPELEPEPEPDAAEDPPMEQDADEPDAEPARLAAGKKR